VFEVNSAVSLLSLGDNMQLQIYTTFSANLALWCHIP
jgi:hypothetical protein